MNSFQSSLKGVFGGWGPADILSSERPPGPWPIFKLAPAIRAGRSTNERLAAIVEREIVPRLVAANLPSTDVTAPVARQPARVLEIDLGAVEVFTWAVLSRTVERMNEQIGTLLRDGIREDQIYFQLIAPSARFLIDLWGDDKISYIEVTVSLNRLQTLIRDFEDETPYNGDCKASSPSAFFAPSPGGQQTFGFYVVEELFRWSGWRTWVEIDTVTSDIGAKARCHWFDAVCLNLTRESDINAVSETIDTMRRMSRNRELHVLAYGRLCVERPWLVGTIGADAAASSANDALNILDQAMTCPAID
jgi:methanogenic corrinoid protein MtbC1